MSAASDLTERMEKKTGQRIEDNNGDNLAIAGLLGAMSRIMSRSPASYRDRDDVAAGVLVMHQMSPEYQAEQENKQLIASPLAGGMSPDDLKDLLG
jgi:di/tripeptidase